MTAENSEPKNLNYFPREAQEVLSSQTQTETLRLLAIENPLLPLNECEVVLDAIEDQPPEEKLNTLKLLLDYELISDATFQSFGAAVLELMPIETQQIEASPEQVRPPTAPEKEEDKEPLSSNPTELATSLMSMATEAIKEAGSVEGISPDKIRAIRNRSQILGTFGFKGVRDFISTEIMYMSELGYDLNMAISITEIIFGKVQAELIKASTEAYKLVRENTSLNFNRRNEMGRPLFLGSTPELLRKWLAEWYWEKRETIESTKRSEIDSVLDALDTYAIRRAIKNEQKDKAIIIRAGRNLRHREAEMDRLVAQIAEVEKELITDLNQWGQERREALIYSIQEEIEQKKLALEMMLAANEQVSLGEAESYLKNVMETAGQIDFLEKEKARLEQAPIEVAETSSDYIDLRIKALEGLHREASDKLYVANQLLEATDIGDSGKRKVAAKMSDLRRSISGIELVLDKMLGQVFVKELAKLKDEESRVATHIVDESTQGEDVATAMKELEEVSKKVRVMENRIKKYA